MISRPCVVEAVEARRLLAVFGIDATYDPAPMPELQTVDLPRFARTPTFVSSRAVSNGRTLYEFSVSAQDPDDRDGTGTSYAFFERVNRDGSLDRSFGVRGTLAAGEQASGTFGADGFRVQRLGNSGEELASYTVNGKVDTDFGGDGVVPLPIQPAGARQFSYFTGGITGPMEGNGAILVNVRVIATDGSTPRGVTLLFKVEADGSIDEDFGSDGYVTLESATGADFDVLLAEGGLYVYEDSGYTTSAGARNLLRLKRNGNKDASFGTGGRVAIPGGAVEFTEQPDGKLLFASTGYTRPGLDDSASVYRLNRDGSPDTTFSGDGEIVLSNALDAGFGVSDLLLYDDGRVLVVGNNSIFRFDSSGTLDASPFDGSASFTTYFALRRDVSLDGENGILVGGATGTRYAVVSAVQFDARGIARIATDNGSDVIRVAPAAGNLVRFTVNGTTVDLPAAEVRGIDMQLFEGYTDVEVSVDLNTTITGGSGDDQIITAGGDDAITTFDGNATVNAGGGDDYVRGGSGAQVLYGEGGNDTIEGGEGADRLVGGGGKDVLRGDAGADRLYAGAGDDRLEGGNGDDLLLGDDGRDRLYGDAGNDTLNGGASSDSLYGGVGDNALNGDGGDDRLFADDAGTRDTLRGGPGNDRLVTRDAAIDALFGDGGTDSAEADAGDVLESVEGRA